jgi:D-glycero-D-manno-heptose 1,7-bisphosphate phosphatase
MLNKALFLDRDGVINREMGDYVASVRDFHLNEAVLPILHAAKELGYKLIIITNQGGIAKGLYSIADLTHIHQHLRHILSQENIVVDDIYFCPHHADFNGLCLCRKPKSLMLEKAIAKHQIDVKQSCMIGDHVRDMQAAESVGVLGIKIPSNDFSSLSAPYSFLG